MGLFPNAEIGAFLLNSSINYYAWTIISNNQKNRAKSGDGDNGITCDYGAPLIEENHFLNMSFKHKNQLRYNWPDSQGKIEVYTEDQIGEEYVSKIWSRFTGIELFEDEELMEQTFRGYQFIPEEPDNSVIGNKKSFWAKLFKR